MFPPGRARLATSPFRQDRHPRHDNGNCLGRFLGGTGRRRTDRDDDIDLESHQLGRERRADDRVSLRIALLDDDVLSLDIAKLAQTLPECFDAAESKRNGVTEHIRSAELSSAAAPRRKSKAQRA